MLHVVFYGLNGEHLDLYQQYQEAYNTDPFSQVTRELGEKLLDNISNNNRKNGRLLSKKPTCNTAVEKTWKTIKILSQDYSTPQRTS